MAVDPITLILTALATRAVGSVQAKTNKAVEEAYARLKTLIQKKFIDNSEAVFVLDKYEEKPDVWEAPLKDELMQIHADKDKQVIETARALVSLQESQQQAEYEHIATQPTAVQTRNGDPPKESRRDLDRTETSLSPEQIQKNQALIQLLRSWREDDDEEDAREQRETWEYLRRVLDEDRLSDRKLFP